MTISVGDGYISDVRKSNNCETPAEPSGYRVPRRQSERRSNVVDVLEKVCWILAGLVLLAIAGWYLICGAPSPVPAIAMQGRSATKKEVTSNFNEQQKAMFQEAITVSPRDSDTQKQYERVREEYHTINPATHQRMSNLTDALHEAKTVSSKVIENPDGTNSLEVDEIPENSVLDTIGIQDKDVIDYIGGQRIDFSSSLQGREFFYDMRDQLSANGFLKIDIRRRNKQLKIIVNIESLGN